MQKEKHHSLAAVAYAQAMLELANESHSADSVGTELRDLRQIVETDPQFAQVVSDPAIGNDERDRFLRKVFEGRASQVVLNFLLLLNEKSKLVLLAGISGAYDDLLEKQQGKVEVDVTTAQDLSADQIETVRQKISEALGRTAVVHQYLDPSIIGGLILRVQDQLIDGSVRAQLSAMRNRLLAGRPV
jgi:F-type H+-transporting ATPase subunit delta